MIDKQSVLQCFTNIKFCHADRLSGYGGLFIVVVVNNSDNGRAISEIWKGVRDNIYYDINMLITICVPDRYCKVLRQRHHFFGISNFSIMSYMVRRLTPE
jgi:hypothetical protein